MNLTKSFYFLLVATLILTACKKEDPVDVPTSDEFVVGTKKSNGITESYESFMIKVSNSDTAFFDFNNDGIVNLEIATPHQQDLGPKTDSINSFSFKTTNQVMSYFYCYSYGSYLHQTEFISALNHGDKINCSSTHFSNSGSKIRNYWLITETTTTNGIASSPVIIRKWDDGNFQIGNVNYIVLKFSANGINYIGWVKVRSNSLDELQVLETYYESANC